MPFREKALSLMRLAEKASTILLTGPAEVDGDSIASSLALARVLQPFTAARIDVVGQPGHRYESLPGARDMVPAERLRGPYDLAIVLDGERRRLDPLVAGAFDAASDTVIVDHHRSTRAEGYSLAIVDPDAASTADLVHTILEALQVPLDEDVATLLFTGLIFDTGGFRHSNTSPASHRLAARLLETGFDHTSVYARTLVERRPLALTLLGHVLLGASYHEEGRIVVGAIPLALSTRLGTGHADIEGIVDLLIYTEGVEAAVLAVEREDGVKLSLRSRGGVDVAALARSLDATGGGHMRAAGVLLAEPLAQVLSWIHVEVARAMEGPTVQSRT
jgi:phosphoesterase RecJ-like protein